MIGIIGALHDEVEGLRSMLKRRTDREYCGITFSSGSIGGCRVVVAVCGVGKVFASMCAGAMILKYRPSLIINTGVAGGLASGLSIGDLVISDFAVQHDFDTTAIDDVPRGFLPVLNEVKIPADESAASILAECAAEKGIRCIRGTVVSGDQFIAGEDKKAELRKEFGGAACEMEGGSIAAVAAVNKVPFVILRAISDNADSGSPVDFPAFCALAAGNSVKLLSSALPLLGKTFTD